MALNNNGEALLFSGNVFLQNIDSTDNCFIDVGNATELTLTPNSELKERISRRKDSYGSALNSVVIKSPTTFSMTLDCLAPANLAKAWFGAKGVVTQVAATVVDEAVTVLALDCWYDLANGDISAVVVTNAAGTVTYVEDVDYQLEPISGMILFCSTGAVLVNDVPLVDYTAADQTADHQLILGDSETRQAFKVRVCGINLASNKHVVFDIDQVIMSPASGFNIFDTEFATVQFNGTVIASPNSADGGFRALTQDIG